MDSILGENRRGDQYLVDCGTTYVLIAFDGTAWTAVEHSRPFNPNARRVVFDDREGIR